MEVQNGDVYQAQKPLQELLAEVWPVKTAYGLAKLARKINEQYAIIESVRIKLFQQYGDDKGNGTYQIDAEHANWAQFRDAHNELMGEKCELENVWVVKLPSDNGAKASAKTLMDLDRFVEVEM
ncbi:MAG: hypothetical protein Q7J84_15860 [Sulfuricaulis sp.]|nr:hypothetical protein [Sulfuricaulis sp.]